jgi:hypothetical protein
MSIHISTKTTIPVIERIDHKAFRCSSSPSTTGGRELDVFGPNLRRNGGMGQAIFKKGERIQGEWYRSEMEHPSAGAHLWHHLSRAVVALCDTRQRSVYALLRVAVGVVVDQCEIAVLSEEGRGGGGALQERPIFLTEGSPMPPTLLPDVPVCCSCCSIYRPCHP